MKTILKYLGGGMVLFAVLVAAIFLGARFLDGPLAMIPGGPLRSGEWVNTPVTDWRFASEVQEIAMQLEGEKSSRTTWIFVHEGRAYIPASTEFPPGKTWYKRAALDGRAILRIEGKRYPVMLTRTDDPELRKAIAAQRDEKYGAGPPAGSESWIFAVGSRSD